jgi:hypothetical protein
VQSRTLRTGADGPPTQFERDRSIASLEGNPGAQLTRGAFTVNVSRPVAAITDGLSQTAVASDGKVRTPVAGNCFGSVSNGSMLFPPLTSPSAVPDPNSSMPIIQSIYAGSDSY